ncbi:hypothetical protein [Nocardia sp. NPDC052566]|uniref:hypothetical protein n=1 Tax=Nocardia sp. NPDC052566 TaxID=3364330 RepID=UPI0037C58AAC
MAAVLVESARRRRRAVEDARDAATSRADSAEFQASRLTEHLETAQRHAAELDAQLRATQSELRRAIDTHRSERMRATTDFETMRIETAKVIATQVESLEDALDALGHNQPQVTEEFVKRSVNALRNSLSSLRRDKQDPQGDTV